MTVKELKEKLNESPDYYLVWIDSYEELNVQQSANDTSGITILSQHENIYPD